MASGAMKIRPGLPAVQAPAGDCGRTSVETWPVVGDPCTSRPLSRDRTCFVSAATACVSSRRGRLMNSRRTAFAPQDQNLKRRAAARAEARSTAQEERNAASAGRRRCAGPRNGDAAIAYECPRHGRTLGGSEMCWGAIDSLCAARRIATAGWVWAHRGGRLGSAKAAIKQLPRHACRAPPLRCHRGSMVRASRFT